MVHLTFAKSSVSDHTLLVDLTISKVLRIPTLLKSYKSVVPFSNSFKSVEKVLKSNIFKMLESPFHHPFTCWIVLGSVGIEAFENVGNNI